MVAARLRALIDKHSSLYPFYCRPSINHPASRHIVRYEVDVPPEFSDQPLEIDMDGLVESRERKIALGRIRSTENRCIRER